MPHATRILAALLLAAAATAAVPAGAQIDPGQRVRVLAPAHGVTSPTPARVIALSADTLVLDVSGRSGGSLGPIEMRLPMAAVESLEVSGGNRNQAVTGATGLALGSALGFAASRLHRRFNVDCGTHCGLGENAAQYDDSLTPKIVAAGAVIGLGLGIALPGERWVAVPRAGVSLQAGPAGTGAAVTVRF